MDDEHTGEFGTFDELNWKYEDDGGDEDSEGDMAGEVSNGDKRGNLPPVGVCMDA